MNFSVPDSVLGRQRCRPWTPIFTQQLRLRHLYQIMAYNLTARCSGSFYYTLHLTTMCAPFYTSEKISSMNPKWAEIDIGSLPYPSISAFVLRIWQSKDDDMDVIISTWGINLSGLVYLGMKLSEIQPESFYENSVIFYLRGGFFACYDTLRKDLQKPLPFIDYLNIMSTESETKVYRNTVIKCAKNDIKCSYTLDKLQRMHYLQIMIKNRSQDVQIVRDKIMAKCGLCSSLSLDALDKPVPVDSPSPIHRYPSQLLTMNTLNKMLKTKPTIIQKQQIVRLNKQVEIARFRTKLLSQEKDRKSACIRHLKQTYSTLIDENEERGCSLMENYRKLSRDSEKLKEWCKEQVLLKEWLLHTTAQLHHRRRQLINQLLWIYPIEQTAPRKYLINGIYLPDSDMLTDCSDDSLAVALGYVAHVLLMCSSFLHVPLRYPIAFFGSRSHISDHITAALSDRDRDFPLYAKGKDRMQFNYAVYLLNKNIAQLRWICGQNTPDLRATLPNLQSLLQGRESKEPAESKPSRKLSLQQDTLSSTDLLHYPQKGFDFISHFDKAWMASDSTLDVAHQTKIQNFTRKAKKKGSELRPGLSEILAIPEAFMNRQITRKDFKSYATIDKLKQLASAEDSPSDTSPLQSTSEVKSDTHCDNEICDNKTVGKEGNASLDADSIEQGTDILHSSLNLMQNKSNKIDMAVIVEHPQNIHVSTDPSDRLLKQNRRISRSVGSITDEENLAECHNSLELGSDPLLHLSYEAAKGLASNLEDGQQEFLQKWLDSGPALVCSEENLYPDEILGTTMAVAGSAKTSNPLTLRTDALLNTTSFNLIKPK